MTIDDDIAALRGKLGARTDMELAEKLGLKRAAVSLWRSRGSIPEKYRLLDPHRSDRKNRDAMLVALRFQFFGEPERGRWLLVATAILPPELFVVGKVEPEFSRGQRIERALLRAMSLALHVSKALLKKDQLDDDSDCQKLITALLSDHTAEITRIAATFGSPEEEVSV